MEPIEDAPGSFRDPASRVFVHAGGIYRGVDEASYGVLRDLGDRGLLGDLVADGLVIGSEPVEDGPLHDALTAQTGFRHFLRHRTVPMLTWPYEWTISMLADAAEATLAVQRRLLDAGCSLKDASAYNVQFLEGRPVLIDVGSIERPERLDVWFALGQFSQMFTFPLLLCRHAGWDLKAYFLAHLGGLDVRRVAEVFGRWGWLRPGLLWDVTLPAMLTRWAERRGRTVARSEAGSPPRGSPAAQQLNLKRLQRKVARLAAGYRPRGTWAAYAETCGYQDPAHQAKLARVERFLRETRPQRVLDLGCNTGEYSLLAARCGAEVVAADSDHDAIELLYRRLRKQPAPITPMVVDVCQPSPGVGYRNRERAPWIERAKAPCVLALALVHHLMVSGNLPLPAAADLLAELCLRDLVLEFVPTDDPGFQRLLEYRRDLYGDLTLEACRQVFGRRFDLVGEEAIPGSKRTLLFFRRREC